MKVDDGVDLIRRVALEAITLLEDDEVLSCLIGEGHASISVDASSYNLGHHREGRGAFGAIIEEG